MDSWIIYLNFSSAIYYVVLTLYLFSNRKRFIGSTSLIGILLVNAYLLLNNGLMVSGHIKEVSFIFWFNFLFVGLFPVFFRIHIQTLLKKQIKFHWTYLTVGIVWAFAIYGLINFYSLNAMEQETYLEAITKRSFPIEFELLNLAFYTAVLVFFVETAFTVFKSSAQSDATYGNLFITSRKYVRQFWILNVGMYCVVMSLYLFIPEVYIEYCAIPISLSLLFLFLVINLRHYAITYSPENIPHAESIVYEIEDDLLYEIEQLISDPQNFREPTFNLDALSDLTQRSKNDVSATINKGMKIGFNDLLNSKRIEFSKKLLMEFDDSKDTIEGIAYDCGFNSKASFYRAFKKFTSLTPTAFIQGLN